MQIDEHTDRQHDNTRMQCGTGWLDTSTKQLVWLQNGKECFKDIGGSHRRYALLVFLLKHQGQVIDFNTVQKQVWEGYSPSKDRPREAVNVAIRRLKKDLAPCKLDIQRLKSGAIRLEAINRSGRLDGGQAAHDDFNRALTTSGSKFDQSNSAETSPTTPVRPTPQPLEEHFGSSADGGQSSARPARTQDLPTWIRLRILRRALEFAFANRPAVLAAVGIFGVLGFADLFYIERKRPHIVGLELQNHGDIELRYHGVQDDGYSPLSGWGLANRVSRHLPNGKIEVVTPLTSPGFRLEAPRWQGLLFPTQGLNITTSGGLPFTSFAVSAGAPLPTRWDQMSGKVHAAFYVLPRTPVPCDARTVNFNELPAIYKWPDISAHMLRFITKQDLRVELIGEKTFVGWVPAEGSTLRISRPNDAFHNASRFLDLSEISTEYRGTVRTSGSVSTLTGPMGFPMVEFTG